MSAPKNLKLSLPIDSYTLSEGDIVRAEQEAALGIVSPQTPLLNRAALIVDADEIHAKHVKDVIKRLYAAASDQRRVTKRGQKRTLVGLAAPQIGEPLSIVLIDTKVGPDRKKYHKLECFINPEIVWRSQETEEGREGCFSAGPVWGLVRRAVAVKIRAFTPDGKVTERIFEGFTARIAQHEIDHVHGIRFADRIKNDKKRHWVHAEELELYPENIKHWPRICSREQWETYKNNGSV